MNVCVYELNLYSHSNQSTGGSDAHAGRVAPGATSQIPVQRSTVQGRAKILKLPAECVGHEKLQTAHSVIDSVIYSIG